MPDYKTLKYTKSQKKYLLEVSHWIMFRVSKIEFMIFFQGIHPSFCTSHYSTTIDSSQNLEATLKSSFFIESAIKAI